MGNANPKVPPDAYTKAGVNYAVLDPGKRAAQEAARETAVALNRHGVAEIAASRGESAYVLDTGDRYLTTVTEALGTKNLVADALRPFVGRSNYDRIAIDAVATILNDLATVGGSPLALTAYWASGSSEWFADAERMADLVAGWSSACKTAGVSWGGGETQTIAGIVGPDSIALAGSAVGQINPKDRLLTGDRIAEGDAILVAPSTGIHANGLTLARRLAEAAPQGYLTPVPGDPQRRGLGDVLLDSSPLYGPLVEAVQEAGLPLHYAVHITGHGWRKLMRAEQPLTYRIRSLPPIPPVLTYLQQEAGMSDEEAYGTFNMGAGFALFIPRNAADAAQRAARKVGFELLDAGVVERGPRQIILEPIAVRYEGSSLAIR